jgi:hypothetical protein
MSIYDNDFVYRSPSLVPYAIIPLRGFSTSSAVVQTEEPVKMMAKTSPPVDPRQYLISQDTLDYEDWVKNNEPDSEESLIKKKLRGWWRSLVP